MKIVSADEMRTIDRATSERFGAASLTLMENAGSAVAEFVLSQFASAKRIGVVCGKGNNGGDGFVAARKLHDAGRDVRVVLLAEPSEVRGDAAVMLDRLPASPAIARSWEELMQPAPKAVFESEVLIDAILGTGFRPPVSGVYAEAIRQVNAAKTPVVAVDLPSGADADAMSEQSASLVARADAIVTFTAPRPAHVFSRLTRGHNARCSDRLARRGHRFHAAAQSNYCARYCAVIGTASAEFQQRKLRTCACNRRRNRQSGSGGDGGNGGSARGSGLIDRGDAEVCVADGRRISSRGHDRASGRNRGRHDFEAGHGLRPP